MIDAGTVLSILTGPTAAVIVGKILGDRLNRNHESIRETHDLVNGRLDQALKDIAELQTVIGLPHQRVTATLTQPQLEDEAHVDTA